MPIDENKKRFSISLDDDLLKRVETFQHDNGLRHRSEALLELATRGLHKIQKELNIKNYHDLDDHGKRMVDLVMKEEFARMEATKEKELVEIDFYELPVSAGTGNILENEYKTTIAVPLDKLIGKADCVLRVSGDSMEPEYHDGDKVLVQKDAELNIGDVGVFILDGEGYIKQLGDGELISLNKKYGNIPLRNVDNVFITGKVIGKL